MENLPYRQGTLNEITQALESTFNCSRELMSLTRLLKAECERRGIINVHTPSNIVNETQNDNVYLVANDNGILNGIVLNLSGGSIKSIRVGI